MVKKKNAPILRFGLRPPKSLAGPVSPSLSPSNFLVAVSETQPARRHEVMHTVESSTVRLPRKSSRHEQRRKQLQHFDF